MATMSSTALPKLSSVLNLELHKDLRGVQETTKGLTQFHRYLFSRISEQLIVSQVCK